LNSASLPVPHSIASHLHGRDNNFNLVRLVAASLVILTHAYGFTGNGDLEPLKRGFGISLGSWAVNVFFAISGFLVCKSWDRDPSVTRFLWARAVRIYPGLWVCIALCVGVVGLGYTVLPWSQFLTHPDLLRFVAANATLLPKGVNSTLPGVFGGDPINSPLWTLPYELKMYLLLLALGYTGLLFRKGVLPVIVLLALAGFARGVYLGDHEATLPQYSRFIFCFFIGAWLYVERARVSFHPAIAIGLLLAVVASFLFADLPWRLLALTVATPYLSLYAALVPGGLIRRYNRFGDFSYGIYIYGAPVQLVVLHGSADKTDYLLNFGVSWCITMLLAAASWHWVEERALRLKLARKPAPPGHAEKAFGG
jgi:peptidoglycan/LPS O-acetylase OafA/YrhL